MDRIAIAKEFVQEQLQTRNDIVAACVVGSVARGEDTEFSDIDLLLMVEGKVEGDSWAMEVDTWRDGVYIEFAFRPKAEYATLENVFVNPFTATHVNDALILYDPTGFLSQIQERVHAVFMEEKWVNKRVEFWIGLVKTRMSDLREAATHKDILKLCETPGPLGFVLSSVVLLRAGITPSGATILAQLDSVDSGMKERICDFLGAVRMRADDVLFLLRLLREGASILEQAESEEAKRLPKYFIQKLNWMAQTGKHQEALQPMWLLVSSVAKGIQASEDPSIRSKGSRLVAQWLEKVGWGEHTNWEEKVELAESLLRQQTIEQ